MSNFSDRPFVAGSLTGLRAFAVDSLGRLTGPAYGGIFKPGENEAECKKREDPFMSARWAIDPLTLQPVRRKGPHTIKKPVYESNFVSRAFLQARVPMPIPEATTSHTTEQCDPATCTRCAEEKAERLAKHAVGSADCTCGFYAYFDGGNDYKGPERVSAVIKGYGVCTVGTRGFRASKAELLAVIAPGRKFKATQWAQIQALYPDVRIFERKRDALEAFPLTVPDLLTPETCDDFWTRSAS